MPNATSILKKQRRHWEYLAQSDQDDYQLRRGRRNEPWWYSEQEVKHNFRQDIQKYCKGFDLFLDSGCGPGANMSYVDDLFQNVIGVDISFTILKRCKLKEALLVVSSVTHLPFKDSVFDIAVNISVLQYLGSLSNVKKALDELVRVTAQEGLVYIAFHNSTSLAGFMESILKRRNKMYLRVPVYFLINNLKERKCEIKQLRGKGFIHPLFGTHNLGTLVTFLGHFIYYFEKLIVCKLPFKIIGQVVELIVEKKI